MTITGSVSLDGLTWTAVGSVTLPPTPVYVGLVVTSHDDTVTGEGVFSQVSIAASTLPSPWSAIDIGDVGVAGSATFSDGTFTIQGAGADIWGTVDAFQFVYQVEPNFAASVETRVVSEQPTDSDAKVGVMIRDGLAPDAAFVILDMKPNGELEFMQRFSRAGEVTYLGGATVGFNTWIRLTRQEPTDLATVTAAVSTDGVNWTVLGQTMVNMSQSVEMGIAVASHDTTQLNTAIVDRARVGQGAP
jgi:hypothetical protein